MDTSQYLAQVAPIYQPQRDWIAQQKAALPGQYAAELSALEQAKINAYRDIGTTARERGMTFSGFSPEMQARYLGATYLPAVANVKAKQAAGMSALDKALADISTAEQTQALNLYGQDLANRRTIEQWQREADWKATQAALDRQNTLAAAGIRNSASTPTQAEVKRMMMQDVVNAYANPIAQKPSDAMYTEKTILPLLYAAYGDLGTDFINKTVYEYRKQAYGY